MARLGQINYLENRPLLLGVGPLLVADEYSEVSPIVYMTYLLSHLWLKTTNAAGSYSVQFISS